jgi:hypothetical protein
LLLGEDTFIILYSLTKYSGIFAESEGIFWNICIEQSTDGNDLELLISTSK